MGRSLTARLVFVVFRSNSNSALGVVISGGVALHGVAGSNPARPTKVITLGALKGAER